MLHGDPSYAYNVKRCTPRTDHDLDLDHIHDIGLDHFHDHDLDQDIKIMRSLLLGDLCYVYCKGCTPRTDNDIGLYDDLDLGQHHEIMIYRKSYLQSRI